MRYDLYVPAEGARHDIRPASAIVGGTSGDMIHTHYEGGGASNVQTFEQRIHHAAGRRHENYPTIAMRGWHPKDIVRVGSVRYSEGLRHWIIDEITDEESLRRWLSPDDIAVPGGSDLLLADEGCRRFMDLPAQDQARIAAMLLPPAALGAEIVKTFERMIADPE